MTAEAGGKAARGRPKYREGIVVSDRMEKSVVVAVTRKLKHKQYGKYVKRTLRYTVHDSKGECEEGDVVRIVEGRPLSKTKRWRVHSIISKVVKV